MTITSQALGGDTITAQALDLAADDGTTITGQFLDLALRDGWKHELRGSHGRWARSTGTADVIGADDAGQRGGRKPATSKDIISEWRKSKDDLVRKHLNLAAAHLDSGDHAAAADELKQASNMAGMHGDNETGDRLFELGQSLSEESRTHAAITGFAGKAAAAVPALLGGGHEDWNGKIDLFNAEDEPSIAAALKWDGTMRFQRELAQRMRDDKGGRIDDPQPYVTALHELIHGTVPAGRETPEWKALPPGDQAALTVFDSMDKGNPSGGAYPTLHSLADAGKRDPRVTQDVIDSLASRGLLRKSDSTSSGYNPQTGESSAPVHSWMMTGNARDMIPAPPQRHAMHATAYQDATNASIEEGYTELGTVHHAPEFFTAMGIGNRETNYTAFEGKGVKVNPAYASVKATVFSKLADQERALSADPRAPYQQAAQAARLAVQALNDDDLPAAEDKLAALAHLGDPEVAQAAKSIQAGLDKMEATGFAAKATMSEYAKRLRDPDRIASGDAWRHYAWQTAAAQAWVLAAAKAEGKGPRSPRVRELADEVNREGAGGKVPAMARQVIRAAGGDPDMFQGAPFVALETRIREQWPQGPGEAQASPWAGALAAARDYVRSRS